MKELEIQQRSTPTRLKVYTLGRFSVIGDDHDLTNEFDNCLKLWDLFKFLITFANELMPPEKIIDSLWPDADYADPKRTFRALIHRLRKILSRYDPGQENCMIVHSQGCYTLKTSSSCFVDVVEFERLFNRAYYNYGNEEETIELYKKAIRMYKGEYLSVTGEQNWLTPARNYYQRMFIQSVIEASDLLKEQKRYKDIIEICELAIKHEMFEEEVHLRYIEALAAYGKIKRAKYHYDYVVKIFEREMGVNPSHKFKRLYHHIFGEKIQSRVSLEDIVNRLEEEDFATGPMICDLDFFKFLYRIEARRAERHGYRIFLGLVTIAKLDHSAPDHKQRRKGMSDLKAILITNLRKGDVITQLNEEQFLISFPFEYVEQAKKVLSKIKNRFSKEKTSEALTVHCTMETGLPEKYFNNVAKHS